MMTAASVKNIIVDVLIRLPRPLGKLLGAVVRGIWGGFRSA
jgi:hypothetical protein